MLPLMLVISLYQLHLSKEEKQGKFSAKNPNRCPKWFVRDWWSAFYGFAQSRILRICAILIKQIAHNHLRNLEIAHNLEIAQMCEDRKSGDCAKNV